MPEKKEKEKEKKFLYRRRRNLKKKEEKKKEFVGAPSTSIITKLATYKDVCCTEARSVEDPSHANNRR